MQTNALAMRSTWTTHPHIMIDMEASNDNISAVAAATGQCGVHVAYHASKGAIRTLAKAAAVQHGTDNIRVNSVHPGLMPPMRVSDPAADPAVRGRWLRSMPRLIEAIPLGRAGRVEEVANAVLFLTSDEPSYITGVRAVR